MEELSKNQYLELIRNSKRKAFYFYFDPVYQSFLNACPRNEMDIGAETVKASCIIDMMLKVDHEIQCYEKELIILMARDEGIL